MFVCENKTKTHNNRQQTLHTVITPWAVSGTRSKYCQKKTRRYTLDCSIYISAHQELSRWSVPATATLKTGSLNTASSVLLVVSGGSEMSGPPSDSDMAYEVLISVMGDMTVETFGISRSLSSPLSEPAAGVRVGRMGRGIAVPGVCVCVCVCVCVIKRELELVGTKCTPICIYMSKRLTHS